MAAAPRGEARCRGASSIPEERPRRTSTAGSGLAGRGTGLGRVSLTERVDRRSSEPPNTNLADLTFSGGPARRGPELKNRYRTTYRCYSIPETSSQDEFSAAIRSSNRHVGEECDLGDVRHRLVGWTSSSALSATPLPLRSLSLRDVVAPRKVLVSTRLTRLRALATCMIHRYADRIRPTEQRSITTPMSCDDVSGSP